MTASLSYWEREALHKEYDLLVIGAGITGLISAIQYKRAYPEKHVTVLERGFHPSGATTRNAGFACFGSIGELLDDLTHESEEAVFSRFSRRFYGLQRLHALVGTADIGYEHCGNYEIFDDAGAFTEAEKAIPFFNDWVYRVSGERDVFSSGKMNGFPVIANRLEGVLHSGKLASVLLHLAQQAGVEVRFHTPVTALSGSTVYVEDLALASRQILVCTNGLTAQLLPETHIKPARGLVIVSHPVTGGTPWKGGFHYNKGFVYFRHIGDRLLIGGARNLAIEDETTFEFGVNPMIQTYLEQFTDQKLGLAGRWKPDVMWSGLMGFPTTKTPVIKRIDAHTVAAAGLGGIGVAIGALVAEDALTLVEQS
jgi:glycine/D-amino acid oxidase-like deaminating enzyme